MAASRYLVDTNHLGMAVRPGSVVCRRMDAARQTGSKFGTCIPVLCELEVGVQQVADPARYRRGLRQLLHAVRIWPLDQRTAELYGELYHELKQKGRVLSQVDLMVAALSRQLKATVLTTDRDFNALSDVPTEDWSKDDDG